MTFDMSFPTSWKFPKKFIPENSVVEFDTPIENERGISFVTELSTGTMNKIVENIENIISFNKEREEKEKLLELKVNELKSIFEKQNLTTLKNLKFDINLTTKLETIDGSQNIGGIPEGIIEE